MSSSLAASLGDRSKDRNIPILPTGEIEVDGDDKKSNHRVNVVRIHAADIHPHPDPETTSLELIEVGGYQVVVRKDSFKAGDLGVYIQPDSVVPQTLPFQFIWLPYAEPIAGGEFQNVPEKRRRITVRKFRKEWSEGLLLPITDFAVNVELNENNLPISATIKDIRNEVPTTVKEGDDISDILGVTHYDPETSGGGPTSGQAVHGPRRKFRYPKTIVGWIHFLWYYLTGRGREKTRDVPFVLPVYDVEALKNYKNTFVPEEIVVVTEKIHGSNARFIYLDGEFYAGSKNEWKASNGNTVWNRVLEQNEWVKPWLKAHEGYALYGEVTPTQTVKNKLYHYGATGKEQVKFFLFDIRTPDGRWVDYDDYHTLDSDAFKDALVPLLYYGPFDLDFILPLVDGPSEVDGADNDREGFVIKTAKERHVRGLGRAQLKIVSNAFLAKDSK